MKTDITMHYYLIYGLHIASTIFFPEVPEIPMPDSIDAEIILELPPDWVVAEYREGKYSSISDQIMWFRLYDEMLIYVEKNRASVWVIQQDLDPIRMRSYILTGALTLLMFQRDYVLVHGSGIVYNNSAYIISGSSGSGKSTTTLNLLKEPDVLFATDDICALRLTPSDCLLYPGPPFQKVCPDVKEKNDDDDYVFLSEAGGKYGKRLSNGYITEPVPVRGMFVLSKYPGDSVNILEVSGGEKLNTLTHNLFRGELLHIIGLDSKRMMLLLGVAAGFPIVTIDRPEGKDTSLEITRIIMDKLNKNIKK